MLLHKAIGTYDTEIFRERHPSQTPKPCILSPEVTQGKDTSEKQRTHHLHYLCAKHLSLAHTLLNDNSVWQQQQKKMNLSQIIIATYSAL